MGWEEDPLRPSFWDRFKKLLLTYLIPINVILTIVVIITETSDNNNVWYFIGVVPLFGIILFLYFSIFFFFFLLMSIFLHGWILKTFIDVDRIKKIIEGENQEYIIGYCYRLLYGLFIIGIILYIVGGGNITDVLDLFRSIDAN